MNQKKRVLFLCVANSCRSQMAEGLVRYYLGDYVDVESAGTIATSVHPNAIKVMSEIGIDISNQRSKEMEEFTDQDFDMVITVCEESDSLCPLWIGAGEKIHIGFYDPVKAKGSKEDILNAFRKVRDEMTEKVINYLKSIIN